jgi:ATP-dependent DNA ligase
MVLAIPLNLEPMESKPVDALPVGGAYLFEPKWDGFRAVAFRDGPEFHLSEPEISKPLTFRK